MRQLSEEIRYKLLKNLENNPNLSQRELAKVMGVSLGKVNYCLKSLIDKGFIKAGNFYKNDKKTSYIYLLTSKGIEEKMRVTYQFLKEKIEEYENLKKEINCLKLETEKYHKNSSR